MQYVQMSHLYRNNSIKIKEENQGNNHIKKENNNYK